MRKPPLSRELDKIVTVWAGKMITAAARGRLARTHQRKIEEAELNPHAQKQMKGQMFAARFKTVNTSILRHKGNRAD